MSANAALAASSRTLTVKAPEVIFGSITGGQRP